ncbi:MAG: hypothetical protein ABJZ74_17140, partial [Nitratireductor sp.]
MAHRKEGSKDVETQTDGVARRAYDRGRRAIRLLRRAGASGGGGLLCQGRRGQSAGERRVRLQRRRGATGRKGNPKHNLLRHGGVNAVPGRGYAPSAPTLLAMITALGIAQICSWGSLYYSFPLIAEAMRRDLGWAKPDLYLAVTIGLIAASLAAYPVGAAIDRGRGRVVMATAALAAGLLLIMWSRVQSLYGFY